MTVAHHLLGTEGLRYFVAWKFPDGIFQQRGFKDAPEALATAKVQSNSGAEVWYACACFKPDATSRTQELAIGASAFWLDLDVGSKQSHYPSQADAVTDLQRFCTALALPRPTLINSGNGIHVYWVLPRLLETSKWERIAQMLKDAAAKFGLKADPARTADIASLMRIPGTTNNKTTPKSIEHLTPTKTIDLESFVRSLVKYTPAPVAKPTVDNSEFDIPVEFPPTSAHPIAEGCAQIALMRDTKGNIEEPLWYAGIGVLKHTTECDDIIHEWSSGYEKYSERETDRKIQQWDSKGLGPTTCDKFTSLNPEACEGCPLKGKITSPIQIGVAPSKVEAPASEPSEPTKGPPKSINGKWLVGMEGIFLKADDAAPSKVLAEPLYITRLGRMGYDDAVADVRWISPNGTWHSSELSLRELTDDRSTQDWLLRHAITGFGKVKNVREYLKDYAQSLQKDREADVICQRFGWSGGSFMVGDEQITKEETRKVRLSNKLPVPMQKGLVPKGSLKPWVEATRVFQNPNYWPHAFGLLASLAAPLFKPFNVTGAVLSLAGESGGGKTTASSFGLSAWADPTALTLSPQGTINSKGEFLRAANNLPVLVDDISGYSRGLSQLIYMAANGRAKERVDRSGRLYGHEGWQTVMMLTTNSPVMDLSESLVGEAERRRVLEFNVEKPIERVDAALLHETMQQNHGHAGRAFIEAIMGQDLEPTFKDLYTKMLDDPDIPEANRFGVWLIAACKIAGTIAANEGLIDFNPHSVCAEALESIKESSATIRSPMEQVDEAVSAWINSNISRIAVKNRRRWVSVPDREAYACADVGTSTMSIPVHRLKKLMAEWNVPGTALKRWRKENEIDAKAVRISRDGATEHCVVFRLDEEFIESLDKGDDDGDYNPE